MPEMWLSIWSFLRFPHIAPTSGGQRCGHLSEASLVFHILQLLKWARDVAIYLKLPQCSTYCSYLRGPEKWLSIWSFFSVPHIEANLRGPEMWLSIWSFLSVPHMKANFRGPEMWLSIWSFLSVPHIEASLRGPEMWLSIWSFLSVPHSAAT